MLSQMELDALVPTYVCEDCEGTLDRTGSYNNNQDVWLICKDCKREFAFNPTTQKWSRLY